MSNSGKWSPVTFDELQAGDRVQVKIESSQDLGPWLRRTVDQGEFIISYATTDGWTVENNPAEIAVMCPLSMRDNIKQTILRYEPPFEFPTKLGTVFNGLHFQEGRHTFVVADRLSADDAAIYRNVTNASWQAQGWIETNYSDFRLGEV